MLISQAKLLWSTQAAEVDSGWILALPGGQAGWPWLPTCPAGAAASGDPSWLREVLEEPEKSEAQGWPHPCFLHPVCFHHEVPG